MGLKQDLVEIYDSLSKAELAGELFEWKDKYYKLSEKYEMLMEKMEG